MKRFARIYELHQILQSRRRGIPGEELARRLGCSSATVKRTIRFMRESLDAPIENDRERGGYFYRRDAEGRSFELPGIWLNAEELRALFTLEQVLAGLRPGLLADCLAPLARRLDELAVSRRVSVAEAARRIRVLAPSSRPAGPHFRMIASALLGRRKVRIVYRGRGTERTTERDISPQRLVHYRGGWYLDAWCHLRDDLRSFAVERIEAAEKLEGRAKEVEDRLLDRYYASSYGIFAGEPQGWATLTFTARAARWVAEEAWHPRQKARRLDDGRWELRVPYAALDELAGDVMRWIPDVVVREPPELCELIRERLRAGLEAFTADGGAHRIPPTDSSGRPSERRGQGSGSDPHDR